MLKSPLNYIGGKYKLLPQILKHIPTNINTFVDLFTGGVNVALNVTAKEYICNDNLTYLIELYQYIQTENIEKVLAEIHHNIEYYKLSKTNTEGYNELRKSYNEEPNPIDLFTLTCFSFNHQIRFNNKHLFNTSFGKNRSHYNSNIEKRLVEFSSKIKTNNYNFTNYDFLDFDISKLNKNDFVYLDPPYLITTGSYNDGKRGFKGWSTKEENELINLMKNLIQRDIKFALSNVTRKGEVVNEPLLDFINENNVYTHEIKTSYKNSNYQRKIGNTFEVLLTNYKK